MTSNYMKVTMPQSTLTAGISGLVWRAHRSMLKMAKSSIFLTMIISNWLDLRSPAKMMSMSTLTRLLTNSRDVHGKTMLDISRMKRPSKSSTTTPFASLKAAILKCVHPGGTSNLSHQW